jgi:hypothetical protein
MLAPHRKKVAGTLRLARISGVLSLGPSSKVSATARRWRGPRHTEGPKTFEERPRTAQAMKPAAPQAAASSMPCWTVPPMNSLL